MTGMQFRRGAMAGAAVAVALSLAACQQPAPAANADDAAASNDPAVRQALNQPLMVDPDRAGNADATAVRATPAVADGGVPVVRGAGEPRLAISDARALAGGELTRAPAPGAWAAQKCEGACTRTDPQARSVTLGGLAREQADRAGRCGTITYGDGWAQRLPAAFPVYPRSALVEAAGSESTVCAMRVVNFQTRVDMQSLMDFYYTQARRGGFSAEHLLDGREHILGGTQGDKSFVIFARPIAGDVIDVDLVTNAGR